MLEILLYAIGIMYTPGPINIIGLNQGLNKKFRESFGFFIGVGSAMFVLFLLYGYTGEMIIKKEYLIYISVIGSLYIMYLAYKVFKSSVDVNEENQERSLTFKDGFLMHLMNPKGTLATLPIATISFPANNIRGFKIFFMSFLLALLALGAPSSYAFIGQRFNALIKNKRTLQIFNKLMAILLLYVAFSILKDHVYYVLIGINEY